MNWWIVWITAFLVVLLGISIASAKKIKTSDDYVMANFSLGFFPVTGTIVATATGSAIIIGAAGKGFEIGISYYVTFIGIVLFSIASSLILGPTIRKLKLYTIPDLFVKRFGKSTAILPAIIIGFLYMTPTFSMQLVGMSSILSSIIDMPVTWGIIVGFVISVVFSLMGGMVSVAWTDAIQSIVILAGVVIMFILGLNYIGGIEQLKVETPPHLFDFFSIGKMELLNWFLVFGPFYLVWQTTWQRITAAKSSKVATSSVIVGFALTGIIGFLSILVGIMALQVLDGNTLPDAVYTDFMIQLFPASIGGLFMVSLLAALLTGATSFLLSGAINISKDIYEGWINPKANDLQILKVSRISVLLMAVIGLFIALFIKDIVTIYQFALSSTAVTLVAPVMAAFFWTGATKKGVITSMVGSMVVSILWSLSGQPFGIHEIGPGIITSFILLIVVSMVTEHDEDEEVVAYFASYKHVKDPASR